MRKAIPHMETFALLIIIVLLAGIAFFRTQQPQPQPDTCTALASDAAQQKDVLASPAARSCAQDADCTYAAVGISRLSIHCALCVSPSYHDTVRALEQTYRDAAASGCDALMRERMQCAVSYTRCSCIEGRCTEQP